MKSRADQLERHSVAIQERLALFGRQRSELEEHGQVVGELTRTELEAGFSVATLELDELEPSLPAIAVRMEGQVEGRATIEIERLDVCALRLRQ